MKNLKTLLVLSLVIVLPLVFSNRAHALGIAYDPYYPIYVNQQKVVVYHDEKTGMESLVVSPSFRGEAKDFGLIIPTPSEPTVESIKDTLFTSLEDITRIDYSKMPAPVENPLLGVSGIGVSDYYRGSPVQVLETQKVDIYNILVIKVKDDQGLKTWLTDNGFQVSKDSEYVIKQYAEKDFYFVLAKINTEVLGSYVTGQLREGHVNPLKVTFNSKEPFIPVKLLGTSGHKDASLVFASSFEGGHTAGWNLNPVQVYTVPTTQPGSTPGVAYPLNDYYANMPKLNVTQGQAKFGVKALSISTPSTQVKNATATKYVYNLSAGKQYVFSAYVKAIGSQGNVKLRVTSAPNVTSETFSAVQLGDWKRLSLSFSPSYGYLTLEVVTENLDTRTTIYVDGIQLEEGSTPSEFSIEKNDSVSQNTYYNNNVNLIIYTLADSKKEIPGYATEFAGWLNQNRVENLSTSEQEDPWVKASGRKYLTKLTKSSTFTQLNNDIVLKSADNNRPVGSGGIYIENPVRLALVVILPIALEVWLVYYLLRRRKK